MQSDILEMQKSILDLSKSISAIHQVVLTTQQTTADNQSEIKEIKSMLLAARVQGGSGEPAEPAPAEGETCSGRHKLPPMVIRAEDGNGRASLRRYV